MSYVDRVTRGVQGLQAIDMNAQNLQMKKQQMDQQQQMQHRETEAEELLMQWQQGGGKDFNLLNQAVLKSPTASKNVLATIGLREEAQKKSAASDIASIIPALNDPATFNRVMATRIQAIKDRGGDPADTIRLAKIYQEEGPDAAKRELQIVGAALANEGFLKPEVIGLGVTEKQSPYQQGTGEMAGFVFNPNTGEYSVNDLARKAYNEAQAKKESGGNLGVKDKVTLNKEISAITKDATMIHRTAQDIEKLKTIGGGPASISIVYKFMKSLDPTSVVREGEFATAENAAGVPETIANAYNKLVSGERLPQSVIDDFSLTAKELANTAVDAAETEVNSYLESFGDDLGQQFSTGLKNRIPKRFDIKKKSGQPQVVSWDSLPAGGN